MSSIICHFWNVGQGLFSSGKISLPNNQDFVWVYDCGSSNNKTILHNAIYSMKQQYRLEIIDLLVISHFDTDHIKGLSELLKDRKVKYWLLPYYPLWQRLFIALSCHFKPDSDEFNFCLNPAKFIAEHYSAHFDEQCTLLLVPAQEQVEEISLPENNADRPFSGTPLNEEDFSYLPPNFIVKSLNLYTPAVISGVEFVPYNISLAHLPNKPKNIVQFNQDIEQIIQSSLTTEQKTTKLTQLYDNNFKQRNAHSLFLYIGRTQSHYENNQVTVFRKTSDFTYTTQHQSHDWGILINKSAILYTGDAELKTPNQVQDLTQALGNYRMTNIFAFQVPHHGSENNWHSGLANTIDPNISIFNADPTNKRYKHPHANVVKDFLPYNPILIDKNTALSLTIK